MCAKKLKTNKNYYFSVEGDTEGWYLDYLQKLINNCSKATCTVKLKHKKLMPTRYAKTLANITEEEVYHLCDYESDSEDDVKKFHKILDDMKEVSKINNSLKYKLGYSNFAFELWIILHKKDLKGPLTDKKQYLKYINEIFDEDFKSSSLDTGIRNYNLGYRNSQPQTWMDIKLIKYSFDGQEISFVEVPNV